MLNPSFKDAIREQFNAEVNKKYKTEASRCTQLFDRYFDDLLKSLSKESIEVLKNLEKDEARKKQLAANLVRNIASCLQRMPGVDDETLLKAALKSFQTDMPTTIDMLNINLKAINDSVGTTSKNSNQVGADMAVKMIEDMQKDPTLKSSREVNYAFATGVLGANLGIAINAKLAEMSPLTEDNVKKYMDVFSNLCKSMIAEMSIQGKPFVATKGEGKHEVLCIDPAVLKAIVETATKLAESPRLQSLEPAEIKKYGSELVSKMLEQNMELTKTYEKGFPSEQDMQKQLEAIASLNTKFISVHDKSERIESIIKKQSEAYGLEGKLKYIYKEVVNTEDVYLNKLNALTQEKIDKAKKAYDSVKEMTEPERTKAKEELQNLFDAICELREKQIAMKTAIETMGPKEWAQALLTLNDAYNKYIVLCGKGIAFPPEVNHTMFVRPPEEGSKGKKSGKTKKETEVGGPGGKSELGLSDYLAAPFQRVTKYPLLAQEFNLHLSENNPNHKYATEFREFLRVATDVSTNANESKRQFETNQLVDRLSKEIQVYNKKPTSDKLNSIISQLKIEIEKLPSEKIIQLLATADFSKASDKDKKAILQMVASLSESLKTSMSNIAEVKTHLLNAQAALDVRRKELNDPSKEISDEKFYKLSAAVKTATLALQKLENDQKSVQTLSKILENKVDNDKVAKFLDNIVAAKIKAGTSIPQNTINALQELIIAANNKSKIGEPVNLTKIMTELVASKTKDDRLKFIEALASITELKITKNTLEILKFSVQESAPVRVKTVLREPPSPSETTTQSQSRVAFPYGPYPVNEFDRQEKEKKEITAKEMEHLSSEHRHRGTTKPPQLGDHSAKKQKRKKELEYYGPEGDKRRPEKGRRSPEAYVGLEGRAVVSDDLQIKMRKAEGFLEKTYAKGLIQSNKKLRDEMHKNRGERTVQISFDQRGGFSATVTYSHDSEEKGRMRAKIRLSERDIDQIISQGERKQSSRFAKALLASINRIPVRIENKETQDLIINFNKIALEASEKLKAPRLSKEERASIVKDLLTEFEKCKDLEGKKGPYFSKDLIKRANNLSALFDLDIKIKDTTAPIRVAPPPTDAPTSVPPPITRSSLIAKLRKSSLTTSDPYRDQEKQERIQKSITNIEKYINTRERKGDDMAPIKAIVDELKKYDIKKPKSYTQIVQDAYVQYCDKSGNTPESKQVFLKAVEKLCKEFEVFKLENIQRGISLMDQRAVPVLPHGSPSRHSRGTSFTEERRRETYSSEVGSRKDENKPKLS